MDEKDLEKYKLDLLRDRAKLIRESIRHIETKIQFSITIALSFIVYYLYVLNQIAEKDSKLLFGYGIPTVGIPILAIGVFLLALRWKLNIEALFCLEENHNIGNELYFNSPELNFFGIPKKAISLNDKINKIDAEILDATHIKKLSVKELLILTYTKNFKNTFYRFGILLLYISFFVAEGIFILLR